MKVFSLSMVWLGDRPAKLHLFFFAYSLIRSRVLILSVELRFCPVNSLMAPILFAIESSSSANFPRVMLHMALFDQGLKLDGSRSCRDIRCMFLLFLPLSSLLFVGILPRLSIQYSWFVPPVKVTSFVRRRGHWCLFTPLWVCLINRPKDKNGMYQNLSDKDFLQLIFTSEGRLGLDYVEEAKTH